LPPVYLLDMGKNLIDLGGTHSLTSETDSLNEAMNTIIINEYSMC
jgi:hypothetical protein